MARKPLAWTKKSGTHQKRRYRLYINSSVEAINLSLFDGFTSRNRTAVETTADNNSYGFRQQGSCADAIEQCFNTLSKPNPQWILEGDIKSCFDRISHDWLLAHVPMDRAILQKWLKSGYMEKHVLHETTDGTPQGGIISPALSNCALDGLERLLKEKFPTNKPLSSFGGKFACVNFIRYADGTPVQTSN